MKQQAESTYFVYLLLIAYEKRSEARYGERPSIPSHWRGKVIETPWKNDIPDKLREGVEEAQFGCPWIQWYLYGGSRGRAWAGILAADESLRKA